MSDVVATIAAHPAVLFAIAAGILVALASSLMGVTLVLRRFSLLGDGLAHASFGALALATVLKLSAPMPVILVAAVFAAVLLLKSRRDGLAGDAKIAVLSVSALALGHLLLHFFGGSAEHDDCDALFGANDLLGFSTLDITLAIVLSLLVTFFFIVYHHQLFAVSFDEEFAKASGFNVDRFNLIAAVLIAVQIVLAMYFAGALLVSALIVFPAITAMNCCKSYGSVLFAAGLSGVMCTVLGFVIALAFKMPVGPSLVATNLFAYVVSCFIRRR